MLMPSQSNIVLYHGTISEFQRIDLTKCSPYSDFGKGFYTAISKQQGINMAERKRQTSFRKTQKLMQMRLYVYKNIGDFGDITIKRFWSADVKWLEFVLGNRRTENFNHGYDLVIGPTADDKTNFVLDLYLTGGYGKIGSSDAKETLLKQLEPQNLGVQYCFLTDKSIRILEQSEKEVILL